MKVCILGAGFVSSGVVHFLCRDNEKRDLSIVVGSKIPEELTALQSKYPCISTVVLDVFTESEKLEGLMRGTKLVISLLNNDMHVPIAKKCIEMGVNMLHASYCTGDMMELDSLAKQNGVTILNEIGLDPGIDHFLAMKAINEIRVDDNESKITTFISYCGGLPEPKISNCNALRYKFSWSPRTALGNMLNAAKYLENNQTIYVPPGGALIDAISDSPYFPELELEGYPNRDSLIYKELYGIEQAETIIRGTFRYKGFGKVVKALHKLGLLSSEPLAETLEGATGRTMTWEEVIRRLIEGKENVSGLPRDKQDIISILMAHGFDDEEIQGLENLGLLSSQEVLLCETLLDTVSSHLSSPLSYGRDERDCIIMKHLIKSKRLNGEEEVREIDFIAFGDQHVGGFSAMSKTVSLAIVHAAKLLLEGWINKPGVIYPFTPDIYQPILEKLEAEGFKFNEKKYTVLE